MSIFNIVVYEDVLASDNTLRTLNEKVTALQSRLNERERVIEDGIATYNDHDRDNCALNTLLVRLQLLEAQRDRDRHRAALWCRPIFRIEPAFTSLGVVGLQLLVRYLSAVTEETRAQLRGVESRMEYLRDFTLDLSESDANLEEYGKAVLDTQALLLTLGNLRIFYEALMAVAEDMWTSFPSSAQLAALTSLTAEPLQTSDERWGALILSLAKEYYGSDYPESSV